MNQSLSEILKSSSLCAGLTEEQLERLVSGNITKIAQYKRNDILFWTDKPPETLVMLLSGNTAMGRDTFDGKRSLSKNTTASGSLINEVHVFSQKKLLWEYAVALDDSVVLEISSKLILEPSTEYGDIQMILVRNMMGEFVTKIGYLGEKVQILSFASVRDRIAFYLYNLQNKTSRTVLAETREEIADYLGIARPSLSRELSRMQNENLIRIRGNEVTILNQAIFDNLFE